MPADNERGDSCGRGWCASVVGFITQKDHLKLEGVMNEVVKYLREESVDFVF